MKSRIRIENPNSKIITRKRYISWVAISIAAVLILTSFTFNPFNVFEKVEYFPVRNKPVNATMLISVQGKVVLQDGCIRIAPFVLGIVPAPVKSYLPLWPYGYSWRKSGLRIEILDTDGRVVARVGDVITIVGGEWQEKSVNTTFSPHLPKNGLGPFWHVGAVV